MSAEKLTLTDREACTICEALTITIDNKDFYKGDARFAVNYPSVVMLSQKLEKTKKLTLSHNDLTAVMFSLAVAIETLQAMKADGTDYLPIDEVLLTDCMILDERLARFLELT